MTPIKKFENKKIEAARNRTEEIINHNIDMKQNFKTGTS